MAALAGLMAALTGWMAATPKQDGWISLFDGKTLDGWKVGNNASTFSVQDGAIVAHGETAHLFYEGTVKNHDFRNFEFKADVMTEPGSNSGIYLQGRYEVQIFDSFGNTVAPRLVFLYAHDRFSAI